MIFVYISVKLLNVPDKPAVSDSDSSKSAGDSARGIKDVPKTENTSSRSASSSRGGLSVRRTFLTGVDVGVYADRLRPCFGGS
jgi:hypothetical protein